MLPATRTATTLLALAALLAFSHTRAQEEPSPESSPVQPVGPETSPVSDDADPSADLPSDADLPTGTKPESPPEPSTNVTVNLINRLVEKGILTQAEAADMIQQAEADAAKAAAREAASTPPPIPAEPPPDEEMTIAYIPDVVRNQMRDQIKQELMARAREEEWGSRQAPDWTSRFAPFGDIRVRSESTFFPEGNDNTGAFPNFNAINTGAPYDLTSNNFAPQHNVDQDRHRARIRARFGSEIMLGDSFSGGIRLATGESNSPTSPNQSLGASGSNFSKYQIWLDRAFISHNAGPGDGQDLLFYAGRFDNPFLSTDLMWDDDLGFDGLALRGKVRITDKLSTFFAAGYFPVYNTDFNLASNQPAKFESRDRWLSGIQWGAEWKPASDLTAKAALSYYDYDGIQGELSSPFIPLSANDAGDTDATRPAFAQRGNTYRELRNIDNSTAANDFGNRYQFQYYGLASDFENVTATARVDYDRYDPVRLSVVGEITRNIAFDSSDIDAVAVNNRGPVGAGGGIGAFEGGDTAWQIAFIVGNPALEKLWDWQASIGYRYIESDAVVDAFTDSDFGGGGTNVQGFTLGANLAITPAVRCGFRWMSADEIAGPPLSSDVLQIDLNAKF
jgi:hypothetical protein